MKQEVLVVIIRSWRAELGDENIQLAYFEPAEIERARPALDLIKKTKFGLKGKM
jgi:hypothetical protein